MKTKLSLLLLSLILVSTVYAMGSAPPQSLNTGDSELDGALQQIEERAKDRVGRAEMDRVMKQEYGVTQKDIDALHKRGYRTSEIYYMALCARQSNRHIDQVAAMRAKGAGWGTLAHRLKVHPGDLNRLRVRHHKMIQHTVQQKEHIRVSPAPKPFKPAGGRRR